MLLLSKILLSWRENYVLCTYSEGWNETSRGGTPERYRRKVCLLCGCLWGRSTGETAGVRPRYWKMLHRIPEAPSGRPEGGSCDSWRSGVCKGRGRSGRVLRSWTPRWSAGLWKFEERLSRSTDLHWTAEKGTYRRDSGVSLGRNAPLSWQAAGFSGSVYPVALDTDVIFLSGRCGLSGHGSVYGGDAPRGI